MCLVSCIKYLVFECIILRIVFACFPDTIYQLPDTVLLFIISRFYLNVFIN